MKVVEQARTRVQDERARAIEQGASGLAKFKQAERMAEACRFRCRGAVATPRFFDARVSRRRRSLSQLRDGQRRP